jgi:hypothetical protein
MDNIAIITPFKTAFAWLFPGHFGQVDVYSFLVPSQRAPTFTLKLPYIIMIDLSLKVRLFFDILTFGTRTKKLTV